MLKRSKLIQYRIIGEGMVWRVGTGSVALSQGSRLPSVREPSPKLHLVS